MKIAITSSGRDLKRISTRDLADVPILLSIILIMDSLKQWKQQYRWNGRSRGPVSPAHDRQRGQSITGNCGPNAFGALSSRIKIVTGAMVKLRSQ